MKKFFILASAAIVALASCAKTEVVYKDAPEEIAFKQITGVMTKAAELLTTDMGVYAYVGNDSYFASTQFAKRDGETTWTAETPLYWPVSGNVDFYIYAPYTNVAVSNQSKSSLTFTRSSDDGIDLLYGNISASKAGGVVEVELKHALSNVVINVGGTEEVKLYSISLLNSIQKGTGVVTFGATKEVEWTSQSTDVLLSKSLFASSEGILVKTTAKHVSSLVVPATLTNEQIEIKYSLGNSGQLTYTTTYDQLTGNLLGTSWDYGKQYTYNINIGATEIEFTPTVAEWTAGNSGNEDLSLQ